MEESLNISAIPLPGEDLQNKIEDIQSVCEVQNVNNVPDISMETVEITSNSDSKSAECGNIAIDCTPIEIEISSIDEIEIQKEATIDFTNEEVQSKCENIQNDAILIEDNEFSKSNDAEPIITSPSEENLLVHASDHVENSDNEIVDSVTIEEINETKEPIIEEMVTEEPIVVFDDSNSLEDTSKISEADAETEVVFMESAEEESFTLHLDFSDREQEEVMVTIVEENPKVAIEIISEKVIEDTEEKIKEGEITEEQIVESASEILKESSKEVIQENIDRNKNIEETNEEVIEEIILGTEKTIGEVIVEENKEILTKTSEEIIVESNKFDIEDVKGEKNNEVDQTSKEIIVVEKVHIIEETNALVKDIAEETIEEILKEVAKDANKETVEKEGKVVVEEKKVNVEPKLMETENIVTVQETSSKEETKNMQVDKTKKEVIQASEVDQINENNKTKTKEELEFTNEDIIMSSQDDSKIPLRKKKAVALKPTAKGSSRAKHIGKSVFVNDELLHVPCHMLGRNVDNPQEDLVSNGRTPPKPRLGVKVPYRNLTSQIVTKQDIANELIERSAKRNPDPDPPMGGDIFFTKKLTQRLANKIAMKVETSRIKPVEEHSNHAVIEKTLDVTILSSGIPDDALSTHPYNTESPPKNQSIHDNSDLLAILEGAVEVDWTKEVHSVEVDPKLNINSEETSLPVLTMENVQSVNTTSNNSPPKLEPLLLCQVSSTAVKKVLDPVIEREMALKQLEQFPKRILRGRNRKQNLHEQIQERQNLDKEVGVPVEQLISSPKEEILSEHSKLVEPSKDVCEITAAVMEVVKDKKDLIKTTNPKVEEASLKKKLSKHVKHNKADTKQLQKNVNEVEEKKSLKGTTVKEELKQSQKMMKEVEPKGVVKDIEPILSAKKVTKTYSRKEALLEVPEDLVQFVDAAESSALIENMNAENDKETEKNETKESDKKKTKAVDQAEVNKKFTKKQKRALRDYSEINKPEVTLVSKRARIIKKKVIWDPDEVPKIKFVSPAKKQIEEIDTKAATLRSKSVKKAPEIPVEKMMKDNPNETENTPVRIEKEKTATYKKEIAKETKAEKKEKKIGSKTKVLRLKKGAKQFLLKKQLRSVAGKIVRTTNGEYKRSLAIISKKKKIIIKKPKVKKTELDKLLMDEGAVNMLYSVKRDENKRKNSMISLDRAQKDLKTRTKAVKDVITLSSSQEDSPKALRKKDSPTPMLLPLVPQRKKSRDSLRSSIQSPPPSPSFMYSTRAEASRIIRRHSNSFSSECSTPRRMSLEQTAEKSELKVETEVIEDAKENSSSSKRKKGVPIFVRKGEEKTYKGKRKVVIEIVVKETDNSGKDAGDRLVEEKPAEQETEVVKEKLTTADKRKLNSEMSKNFSQHIPKKRTRSSKLAEDEEVESASKSPTKSPLPKTAKKTADKTTESVKKDEPQTSETEKLRVSNRQIAMANNYKEISLRKIDNLVQIILTPTTTKIKNAVNLQMFREMNDILAKLAKDDTCRVVLVSSTDNYFCHGIDFSTLIHGNADKRLAIAQEMAKALKEFLHSLATFPKPLVAGVQGPAVGLGVTMLPLFDLVLASDKATFATPYGRLGQVPEGAIFLTSPHIRGSTLTSELLFACRKLTASEALQHGLVTRVLWPDKFQEELIPIAKSISNQSSQCMLATKSLLRQSLHGNLNTALEAENKLLIEHWTSAECQQNFKKLLQENEWW